MDVLELYKSLNQDSTFVTDYYRNAENFKGQTYRIFSTNTRCFNYFRSNFEYMITSIEGKPRGSWGIQASGEDKGKQYPPYFEELGLYVTTDKSLYTRTEKGIMQSNIYSNNFTANEQKFLTILNLIDSTYDRIASYLIDRTRQIVSYIDKYIDQKSFFSSISNVINGDVTFETIIKEDSFWYISFFERIDLLILLKTSTKKQKKLLKDYVFKNYRDKTNDDVVSKKYNSDQYKTVTIQDDLFIYYIVKTIIDFSSKPFEDSIKLILNQINILEDFDKEKIQNFIFDNIDYFTKLYKNAFDEDKFVKSRIYSGEEDKEDEEFYDERDVEIKSGPEPKRNPIKVSGRNVYPRSTKVRDKALENANYMCEIDPNHSTFKVQRKYGLVSYTEAHHLIPMSVQEKFKYNIDVVENVVSLCPICHRNIHIGKQKNVIIKKLYELKKDSLKEKGIDISLEELKKYY